MIIYLFRSPNGGESNAESPVDDTSRERINVAILRNVFFHNSTVSTDREKRLSVIEEPTVTVPVSGNRVFKSCDEDQSSTNANESLQC